VSRRENHDASDFYARFAAPAISDDAAIAGPLERSVANRIYCGDARHMPEIPDRSVALVVTSPPYHAGKSYEEAIGTGVIPSTYVDYLQMLEDVFAECARKLEPGGRIAVNVANLGRRPYRSLSADVIAILQDRLGLLLRGEIIWRKGDGASGNCAWGSFQNPMNPVLRDTTERIVVASKGRFDRAVTRRERQKRGLPSIASISRDVFMEATLDVWDMDTESATRVGHPAPFPVELPRRLIELYTFRDDVVLDPFMGSGTTAVACVRTDRSYVGYDAEAEYVELATERLRHEHSKREASIPRRVEVPAIPEPASPDEDPFARAVREGLQARELARLVLEQCGFDDISDSRRLANGVEVNFMAYDRTGRRWFVDVSGAFTSDRAGLRRTDTVWKALGRAGLLFTEEAPTPLLLLTTNLPKRGSEGDRALRAAKARDLIVDAIEIFSADGQARLRAYAAGGAHFEELLDPEE
jgi:site-specific DNA-methyltransferase (adenine-specific)